MKLKHSLVSPFIHISSPTWRLSLVLFGVTISINHFISTCVFHTVSYWSACTVSFVIVSMYVAPNAELSGVQIFVVPPWLNVHDYPSK